MKTFLASFLTATLVASAVAAPQTFDFKDPKNGNTVTFKLVVPKETIEGSANDISGTVNFNPSNPAATKGKIVVATKSLTVPNTIMSGHLHGGMWLDVVKYPEITFEIKELKNVKTEA